MYGKNGLRFYQTDTFISIRIDFRFLSTFLYKNKGKGENAINANAKSSFIWKISECRLLLQFD